MLGIATFASIGAMAQNSLFKNISTTDQYTEYYSVRDVEDDGTYVIKEPRFVVKFYKEYLATGEGYEISSKADEGRSVGHLVESFNATNSGGICKGYPYESALLDTDDDNRGFVAIGDYVFVLYGIKDDGISYSSIDRLYIKKGAVAPIANEPKKKSSFKDKMLALKAMKSGGGTSFGAEHKALQSQNLDKMITDYLVAMKAKQESRTPAEKLKSDKNLKAAKTKGAQTKKDEWAEAKRYNDSIKATPEHQDLERRKRQNEANYQASKSNQASKSKNTVTIHNKTGKDIYVYQDGSSNSTTIRANSSTKVNCSSNYTYKFDPNSGGSGSACYSANSGCGSSVSVN